MDQVTVFHTVSNFLVSIATEQVKQGFSSNFQMRKQDIQNTPETFSNANDLFVTSYATVA